MGHVTSREVEVEVTTEEEVTDNDSSVEYYGRHYTPLKNHKPTTQIVTI